MEYVIGILVGLAIGAAGRWVALDRDRSFYPTVLIVIATYYVLFAAMAGSYEVLVVEALVAAVFFVAAVLGFRRSLWIAVAGLVVHGLFDDRHHVLIDNAGVPAWWPGFCLAVDVTLAAWLAAILWQRGSR